MMHLMETSYLTLIHERKVQTRVFRLWTIKLVLYDKVELASDAAFILLSLQSR